MAAVLVMLMLGVVAGLVWLWLAHPAEWQMRANGIVLTEAAARGQFSVIVVFVVVGAVTSFVWALVATAYLRDLGWVLTPVLIVVTLAAAVVAWRLGVELGPPDPLNVTGASVGERLPSMLAVDGFAPFLVWPIFGLAGLLCTTWWGANDPAEQDEPVIAQ